MLIASVKDVNPCTCIFAQPPRFLIESGALLPSNTKGIPLAYGSPGIKCTVTKLGASESSISCKLSAVDYPREYIWKQHDFSSEHRLWLICAHWEPGSRYRVTMGKEKSIDVEIAREPFVSDVCGINVWEDSIGDVETATVLGSCRVRFSAHRVGVEISGDSIEMWRGALLYFTIVDGRTVWRPTASICSSVPAGDSWVGPTRELLYWSCDGNGGRASSVLSKGEHSVKMIAWLPGVSQVNASTKVQLGCF
jgi:hypothetical protein